MKNSSDENKILYLEFIRIFAIFFVIFNHTSEMGFFLFANEPVGSLSFWIYMVISVISKVAVPLFFCVSGALLLGKEPEGIGALWKKRIFKILVILLVFSLINYTNYCWYAGKDFDFAKLLTSIYSGPSVVNGHLWYLYGYIAFLICLPFLQTFVKKLETKYFWYMIGIVCVVQLLQVIEFFFLQGNKSMSDDFRNNLWVMTDVVVYPCVGYFLHHRLTFTRPQKLLAILWSANVIGIVISCYMTYYLGEVSGGLNEWFTQEFLDNFVILNCICIFTTAKYVFDIVEMPNWINKIILSVGKAIFGIYLLHQLVKCYFNHYEIIPKITAHGVDSMVAVILYCFGVLIITYGLTWILWKVPVVRKLIGG